MDRLDTISAPEIEKLLRAKCGITYFDEITSTNTYAKDNIEYLDDCCAVIADCQINGRGRQHRDFFSPRGTGIYLSIVIKRELEIEKASYITSAAAVAVCKAIESVLNLSVSIKWPNDILYNGKKVCGILTESVIQYGKIQSVIIGIGINVYRPTDGFPESFKDSASFLMNGPIQGTRNKLIAEIIINTIKAAKSPDAYCITEDYRKRNALIGKRVLIGNDQSSEEVFVNGIDHFRRLCVTLNTGEKKTISSGEISVKLI